MLRWLRAKLRRLRRDQATSDFLDKVRQEARRSLRYNHFFSVALVRCRGAAAESVCHRLRGFLRSTDTLAVVDLGNGAGPPQPSGLAGEPAHPSSDGDGKVVAAILPETNGEGAGKALQRLRIVLLNVEGLKIGLAVYPDDSTDAGALVQLADPGGA